jgi:TPR repeat protein
MIDAAKGIPIPALAHGNQIEIERITERKEELIREATGLLKKLADRGHPPSQYFLADCYANGIGTLRNRQDFDRAFPLFILAAKHNHPDAAYRAGTCLENGWGCRREAAKAVQFYRKAAVALHPGAMYRLGISELNGELGLSKRPKEGVKWLKRSAEHGTPEFPHALHELALLHERGIENVVFVDYEYSLELLAQAAELGYAPSAYRLGECYEYGKMGCPQDPALSIHYYNIAAQQAHRDACFALTAWYLVGSPGVLPQSDTEAYLWAKRAAEQGLAKAMYAVGYFTEVGIGTVQSMPDAVQWYKRAAEAGDKRAAQRLKNAAQGPLPGAPVDRREGGTGTMTSGGKKEKDCVIM